MSHVASVELVINDIASLKKACENIPSLTFMEGQTTHEWYGKFLADSDVGRQTAREFDAETFGKCEHAIKVEGADYEIGVVKNPTGSGYRLIYDQWGSGGKRIASACGGEGLTKIKTEYGAVRTSRHLQRQGYRVIRRVMANGQLKITGVK
jgi:hypothetical protein